MNPQVGQRWKYYDRGRSFILELLSVENRMLFYKVIYLIREDQYRIGDCVRYVDSYFEEKYFTCLIGQNVPNQVE